MVLKLDYSKGFPHYDNNIKTKNVPLIGFEWEVPFDSSQMDYDEYSEVYEWFDYELRDDFANRSQFNGYEWHTECGCLELASPVGNTISVIRNAARQLIKDISKIDYLGDYGGPEDSGGIHVSVSKKGMDWRYCMTLAARIANMCNRKSSANFIWEFSGRANPKEDSYYACQAEASCWDEDRWDKFGHSRTEDHDNQMFKDQGDRIEYRLWDNRPEYLIPALEFAHSTFLFCDNWKKETPPYLRDWKKWLFKQKGYKELKNFKHAKWSLIR